MSQWGGFLPTATVRLVAMMKQVCYSSSSNRNDPIDALTSMTMKMLMVNDGIFPIVEGDHGNGESIAALKATNVDAFKRASRKYRKIWRSCMKHDMSLRPGLAEDIKNLYKHVGVKTRAVLRFYQERAKTMISNMNLTSEV